MYSCLFICSLLANSGPRYLPDTAIFNFLNKIQVVVTETGNVFMLDSRETRLLHFNPNGQRLKDAAVKGSGPGELKKALIIEYFEGVVYVYDMWKIHLFSPTGDYLKYYEYPNTLFPMSRVKGGWVGLQGLQYGQKDKPLQLMLYNEDFTEFKSLGSWDSELERSGKNMAPMFKPGDVATYYNPAIDANRLVRSLDGRYVYFHPSYLPFIYKFDVVSGHQVGEIELESGRIPFNKKWGEQKVKKRNANSRNFRFKAWFPEFFPDLQYMIMSQDNHLVYRKWLAIPSNPENGQSFYTKDHWISIDENGNRIPSTLMDQYADRVVAVRGDTVWFLYTTEEGEHTVARCPKNKAADFLAAKMESND